MAICAEGLRRDIDRHRFARGNGTRCSPWDLSLDILRGDSLRRWIASLVRYFEPRFRLFDAGHVLGTDPGPVILTNLIRWRFCIRTANARRIGIRGREPNNERDV